MLLVFQALATALQDNGTLIDLDLNQCDIRWVGGVAIAKMLHFNYTLTTLNLGCLIIGVVE